MARPRGPSVATLNNPYRFVNLTSRGLTREAVLAVKDRARWMCEKCGAKDISIHEAEFHIHHITPKRRGGTDDLGNLALLCCCCHAEADYVQPDQFREWLLDPPQYVVRGARRFASSEGEAIRLALEYREWSRGSLMINCSEDADADELGDAWDRRVALAEQRLSGAPNE